MRIKATKTSFYKLVAGFMSLTGLHSVEFRKAPRTSSYFLEWLDSEGRRCRAYLSACMGNPLLAIDIDYIPELRRKFTLSNVGLRERGMIKE